jgi:hypothetical protein
MKNIMFLPVLLALGMAIAGCELPETELAITDFRFTEIGAVGIIDDKSDTISVSVPDGTPLGNLIPWLKIVPSGATAAPPSGQAQDFTRPVKYTLTYTKTDSKTGKTTRATREYLVTVQVASAAGGDEGPPAYKIGDTGPAGGLIFYVKGNSGGGWRYLEAAPAETEQILMWGYDNLIDGTGSGIGAGKNNTATIMGYQIRTGNLCLAANACDELVSGGFDDWFLPSRDELLLIYTNLKSKGLGGFGNGYYWSSSEYNRYYAHCLELGNGSLYHNDKDNTYSVRAVRAFQ